MSVAQATKSLDPNRKKIGIVVPVLNYFQGFADMIMSISTEHDWHLYLQPQYFRQVPLAKAWNDGAKQAFLDGCDYALVCNDDILFAPDCIDAMIREFERLTPEIVMVTPTNILAAVGDKYAILGYHKPADEPITISDHPNFSCFLIAPDYFSQIGTFDEKFTPAWFEDNDAHRRITLSGHRAICTTAAPMVHVGGVTTKLMERPDSGVSQQHYVEKWGGLPFPASETFHTPYNDPTKNWRDW